MPTADTGSAWYFATRPRWPQSTGNGRILPRYPLTVPLPGAIRHGSPLSRVDSLMPSQACRRIPYPWAAQTPERRSKASIANGILSPGCDPLTASNAVYVWLGNWDHRRGDSWHQPISGLCPLQAEYCRPESAQSMEYCSHWHLACCLAFLNWCHCISASIRCQGVWTSNLEIPRTYTLAMRSFERKPHEYVTIKTEAWRPGRTYRSPAPAARRETAARPAATSHQSVNQPCRRGASRSSPSRHPSSVTSSPLLQPIPSPVHPIPHNPYQLTIQSAYQYRVIRISPYHIITSSRHHVISPSAHQPPTHLPISTQHSKQAAQHRHSTATHTTRRTPTHTHTHNTQTHTEEGAFVCAWVVGSSV